MLWSLFHVLGWAQPSRRTAARCALAASVLLGLAIAPFAGGPAVYAGGVQQAQGDASLAASATMPLFLAFTTQGTQAHLRISMRNSGETAWEPAQGIKLSRLGSDDAAPEGESYPLESPVEPGQTCNWDIVITTPKAGVLSLRYTMAGRDGPFGAPARATLVVLPTLSGIRRALSDLGTESILRTLTEWAERAFGDTLRGLADSVHDMFDSLVNGPIMSQREP